MCSESRDRDKKRSWEHDTPHHRDRDDSDRTPLARSGRHGADTPSRSSWDDDSRGSKSRSAWDANTPRPNRPSGGDSTPAATPAHRYNKWADDRKKTGATPSQSKRGVVGADGKMGRSDDFEGYEEDQRRLDREWYGMDESEGFDQENNSFASMSEEFLANKQVKCLTLSFSLKH